MIVNPSARARSFQGEIDRHARQVDQQRDSRRRRDELPLVDVEPEHGGGANAALIADKSAEKSRKRPAEPRERASKPPSLRVPRHLRQAGEHEQRAEDDLERTARSPTCSAGRRSDRRPRW